MSAFDSFVNDDNKIAIIDTSTNTMIDNVPVEDFPRTSNLDRTCIETTKLFDLCMFEVEQQKTFKFPKNQDIQCEIIETKCNILDITQIDDQQDLVDVKLRIEVSLSFTSESSDNHDSIKVVSFNKNVTVIRPKDADICCDISNATCGCSQSNNIRRKKKLYCTVKVTGVVISKKLIQVEAPF